VHDALREMRPSVGFRCTSHRERRDERVHRLLTLVGGNDIGIRGRALLQAPSLQQTGNGTSIGISWTYTAVCGTCTCLSMWTCRVGGLPRQWCPKTLNLQGTGRRDPTGCPVGGPGSHLLGRCCGCTAAARHSAHCHLSWIFVVRMV
jgi:hypothetical protein